MKQLLYSYIIYKKQKSEKKMISFYRGVGEIHKKLKKYSSTSKIKEREEGVSGREISGRFYINYNHYK